VWDDCIILHPHKPRLRRKKVAAKERAFDVFRRRVIAAMGQPHILAAIAANEKAETATNA